MGYFGIRIERRIRNGEEDTHHAFQFSALKLAYRTNVKNISQNENRQIQMDLPAAKTLCGCA